MVIADAEAALSSVVGVAWVGAEVLDAGRHNEQKRGRIYVASDFLTAHQMASKADRLLVIDITGGCGSIAIAMGSISRRE